MQKEAFIGFGYSALHGHARSGLLREIFFKKSVLCRLWQSVQVSGQMATATGPREFILSKSISALKSRTKHQPSGFVFIGPHLTGPFLGACHISVSRHHSGYLLSAWFHQPKHSPKSL